MCTDAAAAMRRRRELERYLQPEDTVSVCLQHHFRSVSRAFPISIVTASKFIVDVLI